ncbi:MAG: glycosyltransferase [Pseudomonadota bacterium]
MRVLFAVTSLMGAGHLARTLILARAVEAAGGRALVVSGGRPGAGDAGVEIAQLPPLWSDGVDYSTLLTPGGAADDAYLAARAERLVALFDEFAPDVVVTELWPFGRRSLSREFEALATRAKGRARIYASIRDVLEPKRKPKRAEETAERLERLYDGALVHGDPGLVDLSATWPLAHRFADRIRYTGYVAEPSPPPLEGAEGEVLVAVGGGVIGRELLAASVAAARGSERRWRLRVGGADAAEAAAALQAKSAGAPVVVEPAAPDYRARLAAAACSVSLFGYNTATDLLAAGVPAVIHPMTEGGEQEQRIRADAFADLPGFTRLDEATPGALRKAVAKALSGPRPDPGSVDLDGASRTAEILAEG